jgi:hypothetical protein
MVKGKTIPIKSVYLRPGFNREVARAQWLAELLLPDYNSFGEGLADPV